MVFLKLSIYTPWTCYLVNIHDLPFETHSLSWFLSLGHSSVALYLPLRNLIWIQITAHMRHIMARRTVKHCRWTVLTLTFARRKNHLKIQIFVTRSNSFVVIMTSFRISNISASVWRGVDLNLTQSLTTGVHYWSPNYIISAIHSLCIL